MCYRRDFSRETMRDFSLARSLVSQGWSREKSRSRENPIDTLRDPTLDVIRALGVVCHDISVSGDRRFCNLRLAKTLTFARSFFYGRPEKKKIPWREPGGGPPSNGDWKWCIHEMLLFTKCGLSTKCWHLRWYLGWRVWSNWSTAAVRFRSRNYKKFEASIWWTTYS